MIRDVLDVARVDLSRLKSLRIGAESHHNSPRIRPLGQRQPRCCEQKQPGKGERTMAHGVSPAETVFGDPRANWERNEINLRSGPNWGGRCSSTTPSSIMTSS